MNCFCVCFGGIRDGYPLLELHGVDGGAAKGSIIGL